MANEEKLDWIYKSANSLVEREEYLLGRKVDKTLEQLNDEEKTKKIVLPTPKNHVEHECIPPSIRDFNKIVQGEQVDLSAKLQEDPLVAIKKREEEARRQFLQNPIQLKKLQEALQKKELQKKKKKSKKKYSEKDLDRKLKEKLKNLKSISIRKDTSRKETKKEEDDVLNTILMHKFNALKSKLSDSDLQDILDGKVSENSDDNDEDHANSSKTIKKDHKERNRRYRSRSRSVEKKTNKLSRVDNSENPSKTTKRNYQKERQERRRRQRSRSVSSDYKRSKEDTYKEHRKTSVHYNHKRREQDSSRSRTEKSRRLSRSRSRSHDKSVRNIKSKQRRKSSESSESNSDEHTLDKKIMAQLNLLRKEAELKEKKKVMLPEKPPHLKKLNQSSDSSSSSETESSSSSTSSSNSKDSDVEKSEKKNYGLVTSDGQKIPFNNKNTKTTISADAKKIVTEVVKVEKKQVKRMTEEEKERLRQEMMADAKVRDKERKDEMKKHVEAYKREEETMSNKKYDAELLHTELMKMAKHTSVEERIKSKLNNIQRSSRHMNQNFSKR
ncbi:hypothetical protein ABEB36_008128 [Hypothenemus hampei]|uniref:Uncharacterized protein n=1 Tax=Hypothenemus hampei TaxID=57062 RepID=A0ABD1EKX6_HYPHA